MSNSKYYIAIDLGASNGRVMLGNISESRISLEECHRFPNGPVQQNDSLRWDFHTLLSGIKTGIANAFEKSGGNIESIGVDSWGVDWGLIDKNGMLLENPYHYRDRRTNGMMEKVFERLPKYDLYQYSGAQFAQLNTIYQLYAMSRLNPDVLKKADKLLFIAEDARVQYWEPAKWAAKLRNLKTDDNILLLKTNMGAGHSGGSKRFELYEELALEAAFIFDILDIEF